MAMPSLTITPKDLIKFLIKKGLPEWQAKAIVWDLICELDVDNDKVRF